MTAPQTRKLEQITEATDRIELLEAELRRLVQQRTDDIIDAHRFGVPLDATAKAARLPKTSVIALTKRHIGL